MSNEIIRPLSATELAQLAGVSKMTVTRYCHAGKVEAVKVGQIWIIEPKEAHRFIKSRKAKRKNKHLN